MGDVVDDDNGDGVGDDDDDDDDDAAADDDADDDRDCRAGVVAVVVMALPSFDALNEAWITVIIFS